MLGGQTQYRVNRRIHQRAANSALMTRTRPVSAAIKIQDVIWDLCEAWGCEPREHALCQSRERGGIAAREFCLLHRRHTCGPNPPARRHALPETRSSGIRLRTSTYRSFRYSYKIHKRTKTTTLETTATATRHT